jgi:hypothetical protein
MFDSFRFMLALVLYWGKVKELDTSSKVSACSNLNTNNFDETTVTD